MELARYVTAQRAQQPLGSLACHVSDSAPHAATSWQSSADGTLHNNLFSGDFSVQILENTHQLQTQDRRVLAVRPQQWKGCSDLLQTIVYDVGQASAIMTDPPPQKKNIPFSKSMEAVVSHTPKFPQEHIHYFHVPLIVLGKARLKRPIITVFSLFLVFPIKVRPEINF